jgi:D-aminoacyl-tRNA deacylase
MSKVVIAYSLADVAGAGIARNIIEFLSCEPLSSVEVLGVNRLEGLMSAYSCRDDVVVLGFNQHETELEVLEKVSGLAKYIVVVSRHSAKSGKPSLTTHTPGNPWGRSDAGGKPWEIPPSNPLLMWLILKNLYNQSITQNLQGFAVSYEVTHHGPTSISKPITFAELGSTEREWSSDQGQKAVALATISAIRELEQRKPDCIVTVGFGGNHYAPLFTKRALRDNECYGHMIPDYVIKELKPDELRLVVRKAIELTPECSRVVIEKMRREYREVIEEEAKARGLEVVKYT